MTKCGIACAGHLIVDLVKFIESWPQEGMLVSIESEQQHGGGLVYNCLSDLARIDPQLQLHAIGLVGEDQYGQFVMDKLANSGINCSNIQSTTTSPTSYTNVMSVHEGQRTFFHMEGANAELDIRHLTEHNLSPKIFHLGYLALLNSLDKHDKEFGTRAARILHTMQERGCKTSVDLVSVEHPRFEAIVKASMPYTNFLIINEVEAHMATGLTTRMGGHIHENNIRAAAQALRDWGVNDIVVIHFPEGGYGIDRNGNEHFAQSYHLEKAKIKSTVGAGDAFCAGLLYGLHQEFSLVDGLFFANATAHFSLLHETSTEGIPPAMIIHDYIRKTPRHDSALFQ